MLSTHIHQDHIDPFFAAAVLKNCAPDVPFIGPQGCADIWMKWGVPANRIKVVRPGDTVAIKDVEIVVLELFDRTVLVTSNESLEGKVPTMDDKAVNYLFKTPGGNLYHGGDSHYSIRYAKHGKEHKIDVALGSYGENPVGNQDKMTSIDILRMAEALGTKVVIPFHHDVWTNFRPTRSRFSCCGTTRRTCCSTGSSRSSGRSAESSPIPTTPTRSSTTTGEASRTRSPTNRTCRSHRSCRAKKRLSHTGSWRPPQAAKRVRRRAPHRDDGRKLA